ncbi:ABC transporter permease [Halomarina litorea]|uniref:ABC transporter permease n=1 Tax=Halomarina litorea TaxID=2961595 RepID=UPI0020C1DFA4|nr:ABC transporter permease [Halomarina sp. BCD28]
MSVLSSGSARATGFLTLLRREILRFVRRPRNTFLPPAITNLLYFAVFGVVLGSRLSGVSGDYSYLEFVLPGLVVLGAVSNAFENASFSIFHGRWNDYIHEVLTSPLSHTAMVFAYILSSALRGLLVGGIVVAVGLLFTPVRVAQPFYLLAFALVIPTLFASLGVVGGLWAEDFDYLTVLTQFLLRPLVFFGGVFYSLSVLPEPYYTVSLFNPMVYMVDGVRYGFLGYTELGPNVSLGVLSALTLAVILVDVYLFKKGYGLVE